MKTVCRKEIFKAVESCFSRVQKNNTWLAETLEENEDSDDGIIPSEFHPGERWIWRTMKKKTERFC